MIIVGLTGGIASGKSTVSGFLKDYGVVIVDADLIAREVVQLGHPALKRIVETFGTIVLSPEGELNRKALGDIIFKDPIKRKTLDRIMHPHIQKRMIWKALIAFLSGETCVIFDSPLLFESGKMLAYLNATVVVYCNEDKQRARLMARNQLSEQEAEFRIEAQMPLEVKRNIADFVIDNSDSIQETRAQTIKLRDDLLAISLDKGMSRTQVILLSLLLFGLPWIVWKMINQLNV